MWSGLGRRLDRSALRCHPHPVRDLPAGRLHAASVAEYFNDDGM